MDDGVIGGIELECLLPPPLHRADRQLPVLPVILGVEEFKGPAGDSLDLGQTSLSTEAGQVDILQEKQRLSPRGLE